MPDPNETSQSPEEVQQEHDKLLNWLFTYHAPDADAVEAMQVLRDTAKDLAIAIDALVPPGADRTDAIRKLQECVNTANRGITLKGRSYR